MKKLFLLFLILVFLPFYSSPSAKIKRLQGKLDAVCKELVPDKRVDVCRAKVTKGKDGKLELWGEVLTALQKEQLMAVVSGEKITDKITILPDSSVVKKPWGVVTVSVANMKSQPSHASEMASQAIMGTPVRILKKENGWLYIQSPDHYLAWVTASSVCEMSETEHKRWKQSERVVFTGNFGLIYGNVSEADIISDLVAGSILEKTGKSDDFEQVALPDGRNGFLPQKEAAPFQEWKKLKAPTPDQLIATAKRFMGLPYFWGGTSTKAVDCSGLMKSVLFLNGIILERDASQQYKHGEPEEAGEFLKNLQPGDMVFFGNKERERITHTGLYIGNGEVIHASSTNSRVAVNSLDPDRENFSRILSGSFVGARRILGQKSGFGYMPVSEHPWY